MTITYHKDVLQGTEEWHALRCGILTASEMKLIITPTLKIASNDKERAHLYELMGQRLTNYVEPHYISDDMLRGQEEEIYAREAYIKNYAPLEEVGFVTNNKWGFTIGYSPDGLVGEDGLFECKSRRQKYQLETIIEGKVPEEHIIQVQTGLLVTERKWIDFTSYCGGLPMVTFRVLPDPVVQEAIVNAATEFEKRMKAKLGIYLGKFVTEGSRLIATERKADETEITI